MNLFKIFIALGLSYLLSIASPHQAWGHSIPFEKQLAALETPSLQCSISSRVVNSNLNLKYSPECLEQKIHLSQLLTALEDPINLKAGDKLHVSNLKYALTNDGIQLKADLQLNIQPVPGKVPLSASQDLSVKVLDGYLQIEAGQTHLESSKLPVGVANSLINQQLNKQFLLYNNKALHELFLANGGDKIAKEVGLSQEAVTLILHSIEQNINVDINNQGIIIALHLNGTTAQKLNPA